MDFYALSRKDLQTLCKKNKIPANITNVAMADALAALHQVEGLDEFLSSREVDAGTPNVRTAIRALTQTKAAREEAEGSKVSVPVSVSKRLQRGAGAVEGVVEQENKDANVLVTPGTRRRATAVSTRSKKEVELVEEDADKIGVQEKPSAFRKTPAEAPVCRRRATGRSVCTKIETTGGTSVQRAYSTRRSVRLLKKDLSKMSLMDTEDNGVAKIHDDVSQDLSNMSQQVEDLSDIEKGSSLRAASTVVSEDTMGIERQSHDSGSDVKFVSVRENDMVVESHASSEAEPEKVKCLELDAEPHASNEEGSELLEESGDSSEVEIENKECFGARQDTLPVVASEDAILEVTDTATETVVVPDVDVNDQVSNEGDDKEDNNQEVNDVSVSLMEFVYCNLDDRVINDGEDKEDTNNELREEAKPNDSTLKLEGSSDPCDQSDDAGSKVESIGVMQDILPFEASEDALVEVTEQDTATLTVMVPDGVSDQHVAGSLPMLPVNDAFDVTATPSVVLGLESMQVKNVTPESSLSDVEVEDNKNTSENLKAEAQAEESEEPVEAEDHVNPSENLESDAKAEESEEPATEEDDLGEADNEFSSGDVFSQDTAIPNQDPRVSLEETTKGYVHNTGMMKENVTSDELKNMTMGELKRMLKNLKLDGKSNRKTNGVKEVEKKRTALQLLPHNRITAGEAQIDI